MPSPAPGSDRGVISPRQEEVAVEEPGCRPAFFTRVRIIERTGGGSGPRGTAVVVATERRLLDSFKGCHCAKAGPWHANLTREYRTWLYCFDRGGYGGSFRPSRPLQASPLLLPRPPFAFSPFRLLYVLDFAP
jgi:hypothetical protein